MGSPCPCTCTHVEQSELVLQGDIAVNLTDNRLMSRGFCEMWEEFYFKDEVLMRCLEATHGIDRDSDGLSDLVFCWGTTDSYGANRSRLL